MARGGYEIDPKTGKKAPTLEGAAVNWPGPDATNRVRDEETLAKCAAFRLRNAGQKTVPLYLAEVAQAWEPEANWSAPNARDHKGSPGKGCQERGGHQASLPADVENWKAPKATDGDKGGPNQRGSRGDPALPSQAARWAAPAAQNHKGSSEGSITRSDGKSREDILSYQAEQFFRPPSFPDQPMAGGSMSSTDSPNSNSPQ